MFFAGVPQNEDPLCPLLPHPRVGGVTLGKDFSVLTTFLQRPFT